MQTLAFHYYDTNTLIVQLFLGFFIGVCFGIFFTSVMTKYTGLTTFLCGIVVFIALFFMFTGRGKVFQEVSENLLKFIREGNMPAFLAALAGFLIALLIRFKRRDEHKDFIKRLFGR